MKGKKKAPVASWGSGTATRRASISNHNLIVPQITPDSQLSSLVDLAVFEAGQAAEQAERYQRLADAARRKMYSKLNNLYELQKLIPGGLAQ